MLNSYLLKPKNIVVVGASNNLQKPGGKLIENLLSGGYKGDLLPVNPKEKTIQGLQCYQDLKSLPDCDLAILALSAKACVEAAEYLVKEKSVRALVIISAGFSETGKEGTRLEHKLLQLSKAHGVDIIGPNCIGLITEEYQAVFTSPVPKTDPNGCDFVSASGAFAVFVFELSSKLGLKFSSIYSVGNSLQLGVEEILEHWDQAYIDGQSSKVKLFYAEQIKDPQRFLKHALSLRAKGCQLVGLKTGGSEAGARAAISHTGALADNDSAVDALFKKAGIVRCNGRQEFVYVAAVLNQKELKGKRMLVLTHAGGPGVILTDELSRNNFEMPGLHAQDEQYLLEQLNPGSSAANPIDILATGTSEQVKLIIERADQEMEYIDGTVLIYGNTGMEDLNESYKVIANAIKGSAKPVYAVLPSVGTSGGAIQTFVDQGLPAFFDEFSLAQAISKAACPLPSIQAIDSYSFPQEDAYNPKVLNLEESFDLLRKFQLPVLKSYALNQLPSDEVIMEYDFPLVLKGIGPVHKSDSGALALNIASLEAFKEEFKRIMSIQDVEAISVQQMVSGKELFIGVNFEARYGHLIMCGLGGIYIEVFKDFSSTLAPVAKDEAIRMIQTLKSYPIFKGVRGEAEISIDTFASLIVQVSDMVKKNPEILELDLNPIIATGDSFNIVDARIITRG